jgi:hypothetical protein
MTTPWQRRALAAKRRVFADAFARLMLNNDRTLKSEAKIVMAAMSHFCSAGETTVRYAPDGKVDALASAIAQGRHEVWLEWNRYLTIQEAELAEADRFFLNESGLRMQQGLEN